MDNKKSKTTKKQPMSNINADKVIKKRNDKESFINNLIICEKSYDYKDEFKHVEEKKLRLKAIHAI